MKKPVVVLVVLGVVILTGSFLLASRKRNTEAEFTFTNLEYGDIENTVSASGTLEPVTTVEIGTQVSGIIDHIYVDYNDYVKKNQLLALLDTTILAVQVRDAQASLSKSEANLEMSRFDYSQIEKMYQKNLVSEMEYVTSKTEYKTAQANYATAKNSLSRASQNLSYAFIRSPIRGVVIQRVVEEGQTVASSLNSPVLFQIAEDLSKMEIHALVDESDIGEIEEGQSVRFEVQAHVDEVFTGTVRQIWLQPETVSNVVNYTVVIDADNPDGLLLPGMTASIDFIVERKENVLLATSSALKLTPTKEMMETIRKNREKQMATLRQQQASSEDGENRIPFGGGMRMQDSQQQERPKNRSAIWYFDENNNLQICPVMTGSTDGKHTEITPIRGELNEGMEIISSIVGGTSSKATSDMPRMGMMRGFGGGPPPPR